MALDTAELLKKVRKIEIKTRGISRQLFSGKYHTAFKGRGMLFSEVREYSYGDDVRNIDWNVTARTGDAYVKVYEEERELSVMLLIDVSGSLSFGSTKGVKKEIVAELAATLAFSALQNNDKVGAIFFTDKIKTYLPPKKGKRNLLRIIRELLYLEGEGNATNLGEALEYLNNTQNKRNIVFIISDFITPDYEKQLTIASRRHDIVGINIFDPMEKILPNVGLIEAKDMETGQKIIIDTADENQRKILLDSWNARTSNFKNTFHKFGARTLEIDSSSDYIKSLMGLFKK